MYVFINCVIPAHSILYKNENPLLTWFIVYLCLWFTVLNWCNTKINLPQTLVTSAGTAYHKRASVFTTGVLMRSVLHICIHHRCFDEVGVTHIFSFLCVVIFFVVVCRRHMSGVYNVASFHLTSIGHPVHSLTYLFAQTM